MTMVFSEKVSVIKGKSAGLASSGGIGEKVSKSKNRSIGTSHQRVRLPASVISKRFCEVKSIMHKIVK